jgi:hypothetical protein
MSSVNEAAGAKTELGSDLEEGLLALSRNQNITFRLYARVVLPLDGFIFWVRADLLSDDSFLTAAQLSSIEMVPKTIDAFGSLHYATETLQEEAETFGRNRVIFTSVREVQDLNKIAPGTLYIGEFEGIRFAFSSRGSFYRQAALYHYVGFAVYPDMETQIIDSLVDFDSKDLIVSNSLPAWLALNSYKPFYGFGNPGVVLYPSFLSPENIDPPFATVHVVPEGTRALASAPHIGQTTSSHSQLSSDTVRITLWGLRNAQALDFIDCVNQYSTDMGVIGIMNLPIVRDEKRTQSELGTLAMKKIIDYEISYHQNRVNTVARQVIKSTIPNIYINSKA